MVSLTLRNTVYALRCMALTLMVTMLATMQTMAQDTKSPTCQVTGTIRDKATHEPELAATIIVAKQSQPKVAFKKGVTDTGGVFSLTLPATDARYILTASVLGKKAAQVKLTMSLPTRLSTWAIFCSQTTPGCSTRYRCSPRNPS